MKDRDKKRCKRLGNFLALARIRQGLSIRQAAAELGVNRNSVYLWEIGNHSPAMILIPEFVRVYGISLEDLLGVLKWDPSQNPKSKIQNCAEVIG